jgi:predicted dehydrogenase
MGGGALLEGGVHWVNLLRNIGGPVLEVLAAQPTVDYQRAAPVEDNLQILVRFQDGAIGKLLHSWRTRNRIGGLSSSRIHGTDGNIIFESNGLWALVVGRRKRLRIPGLLDIMGYRRMLRAFARCVREGSKPEMSLAVARDDMEFVFAAYRSLRTRRFEPMGVDQTQPHMPVRMSNQSRESSR